MYAEGREGEGGRKRKELSSSLNPPPLSTSSPSRYWRGIELTRHDLSFVGISDGSLPSAMSVCWKAIFIGRPREGRREVQDLCLCCTRSRPRRRLWYRIWEREARGTWSRMDGW